MKRFWLILLSLGLVMAVNAPAFALDVKFSGSFYAAGMYLDKTNLRKYEGDTNPSTAFYFQRLRVQTDFIVSPGLSLITRFDAMERAWGAPRIHMPHMYLWTWSSFHNGLDTGSAGTTTENENIAFDWAYIQYASPIGTFTVGYQNDDTWGTIFGDSSTPQGKIGWTLQKGPWTGMLQIVKMWEGSKTAKNPTVNETDADFDKYIAAGIYRWKDGEAGLLYNFSRIALYRPFFSGSAMIKVSSLQPYAKAKFGPVTLQAEVNYYWGEGTREDGVVDPFQPDTKIENISVFLDAVADFNMFYAGGTFAYLSGDKSDTLDKYEGGFNTGGIDWNPCLIIWNQDRTYWAGDLAGYAQGIDSPMQNAWFGQLRAGVRPIAALDIMASVSYAVADTLPTGYLNRTYGTEIDLTATYKITNNLSYMLGVGYLFTGDYFKGLTVNGDLRDDYLLINKLTLTF
jgi:hypothetical protein